MIHIEVTYSNILEGTPDSATGCAIACALRDAQLNYVFVCQSEIEAWYRTATRKVSYVPESIQSWIQQFDTDKTRCKPFSFDIDLEAGTVLNCSLDSPGEASEGLQGASPASDTPAE